MEQIRAINPKIGLDHGISVARDRVSDPDPLSDDLWIIASPDHLGMQGVKGGQNHQLRYPGLHDSAHHYPHQ
jgi:hypothetical protein